MQSILRWSLEHSEPSNTDGAPPSERKDLDPAIIDMILGKPDAVQMKEDMEVALDTSKTEDERIETLDHLEMLVEQIDNANDLEKINLWAPLQSLLTSPSSTPQIQTQALWVVGTALQNNPSAQDVYLSYNPLPTLLSFLNPAQSNSAALRAKAIYTLSGLLKHNVPAVEKLEKEGWERLSEGLQDPSVSVRRKVIFLLGTLLLPNSSNSGDQPSTSSAPATALRITGDPNLSTASTSTSSTSPNILTPDTRPAPVSNTTDSVSTSTDNNPVHPNSHSAQLLHPTRNNTSKPTLAAFTIYGILDKVIDSLTNPVPYGEDGENVDVDADYEEKAVQLLYTYTVSCHAPLLKEQKEILKNWVQVEKEKFGEVLLERWGLTTEDYAALVRKFL